MPTKTAHEGVETGRPLALRLRRMTWEAPGVISLDLQSPDGAELPPYGAGAHLDIASSTGAVRQYSLCGDPADRRRYRLGVREIPNGRVSAEIHRSFRLGMMVQASRPRNNFPLRAAERYLFVAGGIGITPLLPMMRQASAAGIPWSCCIAFEAGNMRPFSRRFAAWRGDLAAREPCRLSLGCSEAIGPRSPGS